MTLIKSISGIRGTIGGRTGDTLNPLDIVKFTTAYAMFISSKTGATGKIVVGRDGRISGPMVRDVVCGTLVGMGFDVIDIGYASTPTTELAVRMSGADGGIIITASHNPRQWNALKLLNSEGEFLNAAEGQQVLDMAEKEDFNYADVEHLGHITLDDSFDDRHIQSVLDLKLVDVDDVEAHTYQRATYHVTDHRARDAAVTSDDDFSSSTGLTGNKHGVCRGEFYDIQRIEGIAGMSANGAADAGNRFYQCHGNYELCVIFYLSRT